MKVVNGLFMKDWRRLLSTKILTLKYLGAPTRKYRRMGVALANGTEDCSILVSKAIEVAKKIKVN